MTIEQRVRAAVDEIVTATDPEQVVLFGSVARGTAGPGSDIDLLVIGDPARYADGKRTCRRTGDEVDVFVTDRASAERYRYSAAYLEGIALAEGRTVYAKDPERALKALIVAGGQRVAHRHGLEKLWKQAEAIAGQLPARIAEADLKHLTKYAGEFLYPAQGARKLDPRSVWERLEGPIIEFVAYAERRVPELVKSRRRPAMFGHRRQPSGIARFFLTAASDWSRAPQRSRSRSSPRSRLSTRSRRTP